AKLVDSSAVLMLPVVDEKTFLGFLESLGLEVEKGKDGLNTVQLPNSPYPGVFRFAHGYLYATVKTNADAVAALDKTKLLPPASVFGTDKPGIASLTVNLDRVPDELKKMALAGIDQGLAKVEDKAPPGETSKQKEFRLALLKELALKARSLINDGKD